MNDAAILIVDDSSDNRLLLMAHLKAAGYTDLRYAYSAQEVFTQLGLDQGAADDPPAQAGIDLILLDIMMHEVDGIEVCRRIKEDERLRDIAIVMVTALTDAQSFERAFAAGAMDYITKPIKKVELLARVGSAVALKRERDRRKARERELERALREVSTLRGLLPICASCKKIRDEQGVWQTLECYIGEHSDAQFSHGICGPCAKKLYPDLYDN